MSKHLRRGQLRGEGPAKRALRANPTARAMREVFQRPEVVGYDTEPQAGRFLVRLLRGLEGTAAAHAVQLGLPKRFQGMPVAYEWAEAVHLAAWVRQNHFFPRPDDETEPINEPYTEDEDVLALRVYANPMHAGLEVFAASAHRRVWRGATLGCVVYDAVTGEPLLLSAAHVFANGVFNGMTLPVEEVGHPIYQPRYPDLAGNLLRWGTNDDPDSLNVDAAVATVAPSRAVLDGYYGPYGAIPHGEAVVPNVNDEVYLIGRSSGKVYGTVASVTHSVQIEGKWFANTIRITPGIGTSGDSGSCVFLAGGDHNPVGSYFAARSSYLGDECYAIRADLIEEDLGVTFVGSVPELSRARSMAVVIG